MGIRGPCRDNDAVVVWGRRESNGEYAWYKENAWDKGLRFAQPVGTKLANPWGLHDMAGNVDEFVQDWWAESYPSASQVDPTGPLTGSERVIRGGHFLEEAQDARSATRNKALPGLLGRAGAIGARLLLIR